MIVDVEPAVDALISRALLAWRPPPRLKLSDWADTHFYLSAESAAEPGRWTSLPYQREMLNSITDPTVVQVSVMKSARIGFTKCVNAAVGYYMHGDPCPILVVQPTIEDAQGYSKEEIAPMLRDCPTLAALVPISKSRDSDTTILLKKFPGGSLSLVGANSARGFRRVSRKVVIFDEVDGYPASAGAEGDPIQLGIRRTEYYWDRKILAGSTPTQAGASRIEQLFLAGDQRRYYVPCPHCQARQVLQFTQFRWPKGQPDQAVYVCHVCGSEISHASQRAMVEAGEWRPGPHAQFPDIPAPAPFHGHASFHLWAAYSFSPNASWGQLCTEYEAAVAAGPEQLQTFYNTVLGEPWQARGDAPEWSRVYARRENYVIGTCPRDVRFLTAGVDVQKDRLVYEVVGWGRDKRSWSIDAGVIPGETADATSKGPWPALNALLLRTFPHAGGRELSIAMLAVDSGFNTQTVYGWARTHPMNRVIAVRGVSTAHVLIGSPSKVDVTVSGKKLKAGYKVWPIGVNLAKSELYGWLALSAPSDKERATGATDPPGYCHFPEYAEDYFIQLTAEQLVPRKTRSGFVLFVWEVIPGRENHQLDARVYARSAAALVGLDRFRESDWTALEHMLGLDEPPPGPPSGPLSSGAGATVAPRGTTTPPTSPTVPARPTPPAPPRQRAGWLGPRRGGWLK